MNVNSSSMIRQAVEHSQITSKEGILERLFAYWFDGLVYTQIWEDPRVDLKAMELDSKSRLLTISSGGCNILNYLTAVPHQICAVDLNQYHIYFTRLKLTALKYLPTYEDFFDFYGHADKRNNLDNYYMYIQPHLDAATRRYWDREGWFWKARINYFSKNVYRFGAMGYFIRFAHWAAKQFGDDPQLLLEAPDAETREEVFNKIAPFFDHWFVKSLGRMPFLFYSLGIPPRQFEAMKRESNGRLNELYRERIKRLTFQFPIEENYYAWQAFALKYDTERRIAVPDYLKEEYYETIKENINRVTLQLISTTEFLKSQPDDSVNRFIFLDSQDWMDADTITELWAEVARTGQLGSRIIFRTASDQSPVETALPYELRKQFTYEEERSQELFQKDRSAIYGGFHLYVKTN